MAESTSVVVYDPRNAYPEGVALAGFLAGYTGRTREAYPLDLRQFFTWCERRGVKLFDVHRNEIELFARELEELGRARATIGRRLSTVVGFYRYAEEEGLIEHSPAVHVRRPRLDYESHAVGLDRNELGAFLVARGSGLGLRACPGVAPRSQRAPHLLSPGCRHRSPRAGAGPPHADRSPKGKQDRHHPTRAPHRPSNRPGHRRPDGRPDLPRRPRRPAPAGRSRPNGPANRSPCWDHQENRP